MSAHIPVMERVKNTAALKAGHKAAALGVLVRHLVHKVFAVDSSVQAIPVPGQAQVVSGAHAPVAHNGKFQLHSAVVGIVDLGAKLYACVVNAGGAAVHILGVVAAAYAAHNVQILVGVGVGKIPAGKCAGQGRVVTQAAGYNVRAVKVLHGSFSLVALPVIYPQPLCVHF